MISGKARRHHMLQHIRGNNHFVIYLYGIHDITVLLKIVPDFSVPEFDRYKDLFELSSLKKGVDGFFSKTQEEMLP